MPRPRNLEPHSQIELSLPDSIRTPLDLFLYSEFEQCVPRGKYKEFFSERIKEFFEWRRLDLTPYGFAPGMFVAGPKEMIELLERKLRE